MQGATMSNLSNFDELQVSTAPARGRYAQAEKRHSKMTMNRERDYITL